MSVLVQGHPYDVTLDVVQLIVALGQSASALDTSSGDAPLHYATMMRRECEDTPRIVRFLLDCGASPNSWRKYGIRHELHGGIEGDALADFNGLEVGDDDYLTFQTGACLFLLHRWEEDPGWAYVFSLRCMRSMDN